MNHLTVGLALLVIAPLVLLCGALHRLDRRDRTLDEIAREWEGR